MKDDREKRDSAVLDAAKQAEQTKSAALDGAAANRTEQRAASRLDMSTPSNDRETASGSGRAEGEKRTGIESRKPDVGDRNESTTSQRLETQSPSEKRLNGEYPAEGKSGQLATNRETLAMRGNEVGSTGKQERPGTVGDGGKSSVRPDLKGDATRDAGTRSAPDAQSVAQKERTSADRLTNGPQESSPVEKGDGRKDTREGSSQQLRMQQDHGREQLSPKEPQQSRELRDLPTKSSNETAPRSAQEREQAAARRLELDAPKTQAESTSKTEHARSNGGESRTAETTAKQFEPREASASRQGSDMQRREQTPVEKPRESTPKRQHEADISAKADRGTSKEDRPSQEREPRKAEPKSNIESNNIVPPGQDQASAPDGRSLVEPRRHTDTPGKLPIGEHPKEQRHTTEKSLAKETSESQEQRAQSAPAAKESSHRGKAEFEQRSVKQPDTGSTHQEGVTANNRQADQRNESDARSLDVPRSQSAIPEASAQAHTKEDQKAESVQASKPRETEPKTTEQRELKAESVRPEDTEPPVVAKQGGDLNYQEKQETAQSHREEPEEMCRQAAPKPEKSDRDISNESLSKPAAKEEAEKVRELNEHKQVTASEEPDHLSTEKKDVATQTHKEHSSVTVPDTPQKAAASLDFRLNTQPSADGNTSGKAKSERTSVAETPAQQRPEEPRKYDSPEEMPTVTERSQSAVHELREPTTNILAADRKQSTAGIDYTPPAEPQRGVSQRTESHPIGRIERTTMEASANQHPEYRKSTESYQQYFNRLDSQAQQREIIYRQQAEFLEQRATNPELNYAPHCISRHGPECPVEEIEQRTRTREAPDGSFNNGSYLLASTQFDTYESLVTTHQAAVDKFLNITGRKGQDGDPLTIPPRNGESHSRRIYVEHDQAIGWGYRSDGATARPAYQIDNRREFMVYGSSEQKDSLAETVTTFEWDRSSQRWNTMAQHFPKYRL